MKKPSKTEMRKWEVESALSTLQRAEEIKKNASLMRDVRKAAKSQADSLMKLGGAVTSKKTITRKSPSKKRTLKRKK
jgi:hypothetical protein